MKKALNNIAAGLMLSLISVCIFLLFAEGSTRLIDYFSDHKIAVVLDDGGSRLKGYTFKKKPGVFRILLLGDSISYGDGVHKNDTFAKRLEVLLNKNSLNRKFEVINTGFRGINTTQELWILLNKGPVPYRSPQLAEEGYQGLAYKPDLILLQYTVSNDAISLSGDLDYFKEFTPHRWMDDRTIRYNYGDYALPLPKSIDKWLTKHSKFYLFFLNKYHGFLSRLGLRNEWQRIVNMYKPDSRGWQESQSALKDIAQIAGGYLHVPAVMILWATDDGGKLKEIYSIVENAGKKSGFNVLDLSKAVNWPNENFAVSMTDGHPNAKAHFIAATAIYNFLKSEKLVSE